MRNDYPKLRAFLKELGSAERQEDFARACDTSANYLRKAMSKGSRMDVALVEKLVVNSGFKVPPEELRPDVDWSVFAFDHSMRDLRSLPQPKPGARRHLRRAGLAAAA